MFLFHLHFPVLFGASTVLSMVGVNIGSAGRALDDTMGDWPQTYHYQPSVGGVPLYQIHYTPVQINLQTAISPPNTGETIQIRAQGNNGLSCPDTTWVLNGQSAFTLVPFNNLPLGVQTINQTITFSYRIQKPDGTWNTWQPLGTSANTIYLILSLPTPNAVPFASVLKWACSGQGATTRSATVQQFFGAIAGKQVTTYSGQSLYYYLAGTTFASNQTSLPLLLTTKTGQCLAWSSFLADCFELHGMTVNSSYLEVGVFANPPDPNNGFLVKNWSAPAGSGPWMLVSSANPDPNYFEMVPAPAAGPVSPTGGINGQGAQTPSEKVFWNHSILKYSSTYYDASYGSTYSGAESFRFASVFGQYSQAGFVGPFRQISVTRTTYGGIWFVE